MITASRHRRSFVGATGAATLVTAAGLAAGAALVVLAARRGRPDGAGGWLALVTLVLAAVAVLGASQVGALVAVGGIAVLHRDACEERGLPYRPVRPRERVQGPVLSAVRRRLFPRGRPRPGDLVEVRSLPEILATLDERGCLDGLPFMPEMVPYCGRRVTVLRRCDKLWEYAHYTGLRRLRRAVLLQTLRCDGRGHGGCQSGCHLIWKEAWLTRPRHEAPPAPDAVVTAGLEAHTRLSTAEGVRYVCQATQFREATEQLRFNSLGHFWRDIVGGNLRVGTVYVEVGVRAFNIVQSRLRRPTWPVVRPLDTDTSPHLARNLRPGQIVRVRTKREIESTLNRSMRNRGLLFTSDLLADCGGTYRVAASIDRVINEATGELISLKNPSILLEGVYALGGPLLIPQNEYFFWREIWLDPVPEPER